MSEEEIIAELPKPSAKEREMILSKLVSLDMSFEPSPAIEESMREGLRSVHNERTYSADQLRSRIAEWTAQ